MFSEIFRRMEQHGKKSICRRLGLQGAGHFLTPRYLPPCSKQYVRIYNNVWHLGGTNNALQARTSEIYWNESLQFLLKNLMTFDDLSWSQLILLENLVPD